MVRDIFTGGVRTFLSREDAQAFRSQIYAQHGAAREGACWWPGRDTLSRGSQLGRGMACRAFCQPKL